MPLNLFVLGATGRTGTHILELALQRGHRVTAFARSPDKLGSYGPALTRIQGDPLDRDQLARAMPGHDVVLSVLGPAPNEAFRPSTLLTECAASTVAAMHTSGVERLVVLSAALLFPGQGPVFALFRRLLRQHLRDLAGMETVVQATPFSWTIARPPRLTQGDQGAYRSQCGALPPGAFSMSFLAVAAFMVDCAERGSYARAVVGLRRESA